jgi:hypothetical protein
MSEGRGHWRIPFLKFVWRCRRGDLTKLIGHFIIIKILNSVIDFSNGMKVIQEKREGGK